MGGTLATILGNGMAAGGLAAIVMTVALDLAKPRRRRVKAMLSVESLPEIDGFVCRFVDDKGWNEASTERLRAAAEESVLSLIPDEEASKEEEARHLLLLVRGDGRGAELEFIASAVDGNLEDRLALMGQWARRSVDREFSLRLLRHYAQLGAPPAVPRHRRGHGARRSGCPGEVGGIEASPNKARRYESRASRFAGGSSDDSHGLRGIGLPLAKRASPAFFGRWTIPTVSSAGNG